jgi:hypothetical protein
MKNKNTLTRRGFLAGAAAVTAGALAGRAHGEEKTYPPGTYVDIHTHLTQQWGPRYAMAPELLLKWMDEQDISQAVVLPLIAPESWDHPISSGWVLEQTKPHRDRLIPFCDIDPRIANLGSYQDKLDQLKRYVDAGAKGLGEHKPGVAMDDPHNIEIFQACGEMRLPVLFHLDNRRNYDKPGLPGLEKVLKECPDTNFIGHAQGWWASISGDTEQDQLQSYPKGPVAEGGALDRLMDNYPNIYGDLSAGSGANAIGRDMDFGRAFVIRRADRLLWGTDYLAPNQQCLQFSLYPKLELPEDVQAKVFRDNARRLLNL